MFYLSESPLKKCKFDIKSRYKKCKIKQKKSLEKNVKYIVNLLIIDCFIRMSLKRKIYSKFLEWKNDPNRMPLVVKGLRQCGKTYSVLDFARKNYTHVVYLNFEAYPQLGQAFEGTLAVDHDDGFSAVGQNFNACSR